MVLLRKVLKLYLSVLSRIAINKHSMEMIVIVGWHGTQIVREACYDMLNDKFLVRRNTRDIWWDLSVPLTILGYEDRQRNFIEWMVLCAKSFAYLLFGPKAPHKIVISLDTFSEASAKFWSGFIKPDYLIVVNFNKDNTLVRNLIENTIKCNGKIICNRQEYKQKLKRQNLFTFGTGLDVDLSIRVGKDNVQYKYKKEKVRISLDVIPKFSAYLFASVLSLAVLYKVDLIEASYAATKMNFHSRIISKIIKNL